MNQKENKVYVVGSINYDISISVDKMPVKGETKSGFDFMKNIGGKGANQAVSASKLGCKTKLIAAVGNDLFGVEALAAIKDNHIDVSAVFTANTETGMAFITRENAENRIILHQGANHELDIDHVLNALDGKSGDILVGQYEIPFEVTKQAFKKGKSLGMTTILNPAPAAYNDVSIYPYVDYLIVNQTECEILSSVYPRNNQDVRKASNYFFANGVKQLIVTLGSRGSIYINPNTLIEINAYKVESIDSTGAGDAYVGGVCYGLINGIAIEHTIKIASAAGAHACLSAGAQHAMGTYEDILKIMEG